MTANAPFPENIRLRKRTRVLEVEFDDGSAYSLPAEYLRVHSPSAEVQGHSPETATLVTGKSQVAISDIEQVGRYAVRLVFDDGHDTGLYTWTYLYELGRDQANLWSDYQDRVRAQSGSPGQARMYDG
jgi:DUF971 family protein